MITAHFPPFDKTKDEEKWYYGHVYKPAIPELNEREMVEALGEWASFGGEVDKDDDWHNAALKSLLKEESPWERTRQVGGTHYAEMSVQPWEAMRAWMTPSEYLGYHVGTVIGYLSRHRKKGGLQDLKKAKHHMEELIRYFENDEEYPG